MIVPLGSQGETIEEERGGDESEAGDSERGDLEGKAKGFEHRDNMPRKHGRPRKRREQPMYMMNKIKIKEHKNKTHMAKNVKIKH